MSSGCGDVLSLADLQTAKKHQIFEAEVITGKSGGVAGGADIDYATNAVTGQTQKTLPAVLRDAGFSPVSWDFSTGGTLTVNDRDKVVYDPVSQTWYSYAGTLPVVVPASFNPVGNANWKPQTDPYLRDELANPADGFGADLVAYSSTEAVRDAISRIDGDMFQDPLTKWPLGKTLKIKQGVYNVTTPLTLSYENYPPDFIGAPGVRAHYEGENMAETIFECQAADFNIKLIGGADFSTQRIAAYDYFGNMTLKGNSSSYGMLIQNKAHTRLENIVICRHPDGEGLRTDSVLTSDLTNVYLQSNRIGWRAMNSGDLSELNAITANRLTCSQNSEWGILGDRWGAGTTINSLTCEGNGTAGNNATGGMNIAVNGLNGSGAVVLNNPYFEFNAGGADLLIDNTGTRPVTVVINGGNFHRVDATIFTTYNILASSSGGGKLTVILNGTTFQSAGSYAPNAARPYWRALNNAEIIDIGCVYNEEVSKQSAVASSGVAQLGRVKANGTMDTNTAGMSSTRLSAGRYQITAPYNLGTGSSGYIVSVSPQANGNSVTTELEYVSGSQFIVQLRNSVSGAGFDSIFSFIVHRIL